MPQDTEKRKRRRRRKKGGTYITVISVLMLAAVAVGLGMFFLISDIEVAGAEKYAAQEIADASGIETGKSIFLLNKSAVKDNILDGFPYVESVEVSVKLPGKVIVTVTESTPLAWVAGDGRWIIDKNLRLLENTDMAGTLGLIEIAGMMAVEPSAGGYLAGKTDEKLKVSYLGELLSALYGLDMCGDVKRIDMTSASDIRFDYLGRFTILLGRGENVEDKLSLLRGVVARLEADERGRIDLSTDGRASFLPS